jgi:hypothetical protein
MAAKCGIGRRFIPLTVAVAEASGYDCPALEFPRCPVSEVRQASARFALRTSETKGTRKLGTLVLLFDLKILGGDGTGASKRQR